MNALSQAIVALFESEMFYAELVSQMRRVINPTLPSVAGVCIRNSVELHINPTFKTPDGLTFADMPITERVAILKHECEHILRDHINRAKELAPEVFQENQDVADQVVNSIKHVGLNAAMDCAINYSLPNLPKWGCFPKTFGLKDGETFEWYHQNMQQDEKAREKLKQMTGIDPHALWKETTGTKEVVKEKIRQAVNRAAKNTRAAGRMTSENELVVDEFNNAGSIDWRAQLKRFVAKSIATKLESSRKKRNRRYGIHIPGNVKIEELHIGVAMDTSGSISDDELVQFMKEIHNIAKHAKVTVVEADSEIKNSYVFDPKKKYRVKGRGGTAYKPAFDWFNKDKTIDAMIYFGDGDCFDTEALEKPKYPVLWAFVGPQKPPADFGSLIRVSVNDKT